MTSRTTTATNFRIEGKGYVPAAELDHAREMLEGVIEMVNEPALSAKALLAQRPNNSVEHGYEAEASINLQGDWVRAHSFAPSMTEAVDSLKDKLRSQVRHRADRRRTESIRRETTDGTWRHGSRRADRPPFFERSIDDRELVRHKTFATPTSTVEEALWDMAQLDYDFFLFCDEDTGGDAVVSAGEEDGQTTMESIELAPELNVDGALDWLNTSGQRFVFFKDSETGRGSVVYRRYDGDYGLLTPR